MLIVVEGGPNSIRQACEAVENGTPIVVVDNSGRAANALAYAFKEYKNVWVDQTHFQLNISYWMEVCKSLK